MTTRLPRLQLFEFNDAPWAPEALRTLVIESLGVTLARGRLLDGLVAPLAEFLAASGVSGLLELGSGSGVPARVLLEALAARGHHPQLRLSDLQPHPAAWQALAEAFPGQLDFVPEPVDATAIPEQVSAGRGRLILHVLHHLPPSLVRGLLADAVRARQPLFIAESFGRNPLAFLGGFAPHGLPALLGAPLRAGTPRARALRAGLVWGSPIGLAVSVWDGLVSSLRIYERPELEAMLADIPGARDFVWRFGTYPVSRFGDGLWLSGWPA
jgi:hypothetical protein